MVVDSWVLSLCRVGIICFCGLGITVGGLLAFGLRLAVVFMHYGVLFFGVWWYLLYV